LTNPLALYTIKQKRQKRRQSADNSFTVSTIIIAYHLQTTTGKYSLQFTTEYCKTACNLQFKLKVTKNNFQCADKEHFETQPQQSLAYRIFLLITKSDMHSSVML